MEIVKINTEIAITFITYSALMLFIGFYFFTKNKNTEDYFLGGRSLGPVISALSAGASDMSGWLLLGLPGALYVSGFIESYIAIGLTIGAFLNWSFVAKRLRIYTSVIANSITIPDYFETRFDDDKHILRVVCALVILVFFTFYVSSGLVSGAKLFESTFGLQYEYALITGTLIIVAYTFLGGYKAVCWTDLIQGLLMMGALIIVPITMLNHLGGFSEAMEIVAQIKPEALSMGEGVSALAIISALAWGLGYFGQPHILVRFMSIRSTKEIPNATFIGISWMAISLIGSCFIGVLGIAYVDKFDLSLSDPEKIFIVMSQLLFDPWVAGILLSAILAAIMSTASSQLLVSSSTIAE
ncbi:sodium/proline symporter PutP, partial [uncultured Helicobacter sp.]